MKYVGFERTWWRLFRKRVVRTKFNIYVFITKYQVKCCSAYLLVSQTRRSTTLWSSKWRNFMNWEWSWTALSLHEIPTLVNQTSPDYTTETHGPLLAGTASSILIFSSESASVRTRFCGFGHLALVRWIMTSFFMMTSFKFRYYEFQIQVCYISIEIYIVTVSIANCVFAYNTLLSMSVKNDKNVALAF